MSLCVAAISTSYNFQVRVKNPRTKIREEDRIRVYETSIALQLARAKVHYPSTFTYLFKIPLTLMIFTQLTHTLQRLD